MKTRRRTNRLIIAATCYSVILCLCQQTIALGMEHLCDEKTDRQGDPLPFAVLRRIGTIRFLHNGEVTDVIFTDNGKQVLSVGYDNMIRIWDARGKPIKQTSLPPGVKRPIVLSRNGDLLAAQDRDKTVCVINTTTGKRLPCLFGVRSRVCCAMFSPTGRILAWSDSEGRIILWDVIAAKQLLSFTGPKGYEIENISLSPDGKLLAAGGFDKTAFIWETRSGKMVGKVTIPIPERRSQEKIHTAVSFAPGGSKLVVLASGQVFIWDVASWRLLHELSCKDSYASVVAFSPDGNKVASGGVGIKPIMLWDIASGKRIRLFTMRPAHSHEMRIKALAFSPDGRTIAAACADHRVCLWDVDTGKEKSNHSGHIGQIESILFSRDGKILCTRGGDGTVRLWHPQSAEAILRISLGNNSPKWHSACFLADGKVVASVSGNSQLSLWNTTTGKLVRNVLVAPMQIGAFAISTDDRLLAIQGFDSNEQLTVLRLYDLQRDRVFVISKDREKTDYTIITPDNQGVLSFSPNNKLLAYPTPHKGICLYDIAARKILRLIEHPDPILAVAFSPNGALIASGGGGYDRIGVVGASVKLWDAYTGTLILHLTDFQSPVTNIAFSPDGRLLASASEDGQFRFWEVASGNECLRLQDKGCISHAITFAPDGQSLATGMSNGTTLIWRLAPVNWHPPTVGSNPQEFAVRWNSLASIDAIKSYRAIWDLATSPAETVAFLKERLHPVPVVKPERLNQLIADLDSDFFARREAASRELSSLGTIAESALRKARENCSSAELRRRVESLLQALPDWAIKDPNTLQIVRAIWVLQRIGTPQARAILEKLAAGAPEVRQTQEAKAALHFLDSIEKGKEDKNKK